jgi:hypothetical protein
VEAVSLRCVLSCTPSPELLVQVVARGERDGEVDDRRPSMGWGKDFSPSGLATDNERAEVAGSRNIRTARALGLAR